MSGNSVLKIGVRIDLPGVDNPAVGITSGVFLASESDSDIYGVPAITGVLSRRWLGSITKSVDIRRGGGYASLNGSQVKISANFGLLEYLKSVGASLQSKKISIVYEYIGESGTLRNGSLYVGIITEVSPDLDYITLKSDSVSRGYNSTASTHVIGTDKQKPIFIGLTPETRVKPLVVTGDTVPVEVSGVAYPTVWKVTKSTRTWAEIFPANQSISASTVAAYFDEMATINSDVTRGTSYLEVIAGEGQGFQLPISPTGYTIIGSPSMGYGVRLNFQGYNNRFPEGIRGKLADRYDNGTYQATPENWSIVRFVEVTEFLQMDGWASTVGTWDNVAETYDSETDTYGPAPSYGGGFVATGDRIDIVSPFGDSPLPMKEITSNTVVAWATPADLEGLTLDAYPDEVKQYFHLGSANHLGRSVWADYDVNNTPPASAPVVSSDSELDLPLIVDGSISTSYATQVVGDAVGGRSFIGATFVLKMGLPSFAKKPTKIMLTMRQKATSTFALSFSDIMVGVLVNNFHAWELADYKFSQDYPFTVAPTNSSGIDGMIVDNLFLSGLSNYQYKDANLDGKRMNSAFLVGKESLTIELDDYVLNSQNQCFLVITVSNQFFVGDIDFETWGVQWVGEYGADLENTVFNYGSRPSSGIGEAYEHFLKLQNYTSQGVTKPFDGWGSEYPSGVDWSTLIDTGNNYGGTGYVSLNPASNLRGQRFGTTTEELKKEICKATMAIGTVSNNGVEKIYPVLNALYDTTGVLIGYGDIEGEFDFDMVQYSDIFTQGRIRYAYDVAAGKYRGEISVNSVDAPYYSSTYVTGISNPAWAAQLWALANRLWKTYGVINEFPTELGEVPLLVDEVSAYIYLQSLYNLQGASGNEPSAVTTLERYTCGFTLPLDYFIGLDLDHGSKIRLDIPTITTVEPHNGLITGVSISVGDKPVVKVTASMLGDITTTGINRIIRQSGAQTTQIQESGSRTTIYRQGAQ